MTAQPEGHGVPPAASQVTLISGWTGVSAAAGFLVDAPHSCSQNAELAPMKLSHLQRISALSGGRGPVALAVLQNCG